MITKSPSGALSPYYYKGGYFHGIHYGSYFRDKDALFDMIGQEEAYILKSPEQRRILMDFYETELDAEVIQRIISHISALSPRIYKLAIATDKKSLKTIRHALKKSKVLSYGKYYLSTDMEDGKTWLVDDSFLH